MSNRTINAAMALANIIDSDPVLAGQLKEHLSTERLLDLLDIPVDELIRYASTRPYLIK